MAAPQTIKYAGANLYPKQRDAIFDPSRISVLEGGTKSGKSIGALAWLLEQAFLGKQGRQYWWVSPVFGQAEVMFRRLGHKLPKSYFKRNQSKMTITLTNGTTIWFRSGEQPDTLYGEDVWAVVMDEASRMREEAWHAVRSTLTFTQGPVRIIGNVKGRKNWFYTLARQAEDGDPDMAYHRITCWDAVDAGVLNRDEIEASFRDYKRLGREGAWKQLYLAEAVGDEDNPFGIEAIANCLVGGLSNEFPRVAGVDLAGRGAHNLNTGGPDEVANRDYTAIVMLDRDGNATHISRFRKPHTETAEEVARVVKRTSALIDSTGTGDAVVEGLQRRGDMHVEGFTFTERSRQDLLEGLALAIGEERVHFPDGDLRDELDLFEYRHSPRGMRFAIADGKHDDLTMALALAVKKLPWRARYVSAPIGVAKPGGSQWTGSESVVADPLLSPASGAAQPAAVNVPILVSGSGAGRWREPS